jgi:hypothetical protein
MTPDDLRDVLAVTVTALQAGRLDGQQAIASLVAQVARLIADARAEALRDAADHFDKYDVVTIEDTDIGSNQVPVPPAECLRDLADRIEGGGDR